MSTTHSSTLDLDKIKDNLGWNEDKLKSLGVEYLILAGSSARGDDTELSDIDIFVALPEIHDLLPDEKWRRVKLVNSIIYDIVGQDRLDLSIIENLPLKVKFSVLTEGILLFGNSEQYHIDKGDIIVRYLDFKPFLEKYYRYQRVARERNDLDPTSVSKKLF